MLKNPPAKEDRYLVCFVCLVFWSNETNQMSQINQKNKTNQFEHPAAVMG